MCSSKLDLSTSTIYQCICAKHTTHLPQLSIGRFFAEFEEWLGRDIKYVNDSDILDKIDKFISYYKKHQQFIHKEGN